MINCCLQCGKEIPIYDKKGRRNHYCRGHIPYSFTKGRIVSEETKIKISNTLETTHYFRGKHLSEEHKKKISDAKKGKHFGGKSEWDENMRSKNEEYHKKAKESGFWGSWGKGVKRTIETRKKMSESQLDGFLNGRKPSIVKCVKYISKSEETILMRSTWEYEFAKYLDSINELWYYEFWTFDLGDTTYTPDFYLPRRELFIEIKGRWREANKLKYERFLDEYCFENILLIQQKPPYNNIKMEE